MVKDIISKPLLKTTYIDNRNGDKVLYLEVPERISRSMVVNEVKGSGKHFESTLKYIDKENRSRMVLISAENQELGFIAVSYIAGAVGDTCTPSEYEQNCSKNQKPVLPAKEYFIDEDEDPFWDDMPEEQWIERKGRIPVIHASDVVCFYSSGYTSVDFGMTLRSGQNQHNDKVPYWTRCRKEAVCIVLDDTMGRQEIDILRRFSTNKRVYVVFAQRGEHDLVESDAMGLPFGSSAAEMNAQKNRAVLYYGMDEIQVFLTKEYKWKYYGDVTKQAFRDHGIVNTTTIPYDRIVSVAEGVAASNMCSAINKIVEYAIKDYPNGLLSVKRLKKADFDFLDRFENRKTLGTKSASEKLQNEIIGLDDIKKQIKQIINVMKLNSVRSEMGLKGENFHNVHIMLGAPGTAKTTVAKLMGEIMTEESLLPGKRTIVVNGAQLKGEYVGQSAPKTHALFECHDIIIIDEAYSMVDTAGGTDSFSNEAIAQLIIELEKHATDKLVIFAGYGGTDVVTKDNRMQLFLDANPGIQSRISSTLYFPSYTPDEMVKVFFGIAKRNHYCIDAEADVYVKKYFASRVAAKDFGNGREARNLLDACTLFLADRIADKDRTQISKEEIMNITAQDVKKAVNYLRESFATRNNKNESRIGFRTEAV